MKSKKLKNLRFKKESVANLSDDQKSRIIGGATRAWTGCLTFDSMCPTSCYAH
ncbi:class I lanthipeptide [Flavobacteriaceae bacterium M23B6Z8]